MLASSRSTLHRDVQNGEETPMSDTLIAVKPEIAARAHVNAEGYRALAARAASDPAGFWAEQLRRLDWIKTPTKMLSGDFSGDVRIRWFEDGVLNAAANCLDRHLATRGDQVAIIWE